MGEMQPVPATCTYPAQLLAEPCAGTVGGGAQALFSCSHMCCHSHSVLSQPQCAVRPGQLRQLLEKRFLQ